MKRVDENPPPRYPDRRIHESEGTWWIAKIKPRQEKALAFDLIRHEIEYYLPMYTKVVRRRDNNKPRKSVLPLFPGYISFCTPIVGGENKLYATRRVVRVVEVRHQRRFMDELEQIYYTLDLGIALAPFEPPRDYAPGEMVEVRSGPLRGIRGSVVRIAAGHKLVLSVEGLGRAAVSVDARVVKAL